MVTATTGKYCILCDMNEKTLIALEILGENLERSTDTTHLSDCGRFYSFCKTAKKGLG